ncbi:MAG: alkaline phosphatase family protein [Gemmatimonadetes bacterium]|nr:alkaline phosphatase family protein [Gemmatimonadota bacterium]MBI3504617.1 alkaline phosphatase family protein [Pseudomonadota bacterium]
MFRRIAYIAVLALASGTLSAQPSVAASAAPAAKPTLVVFLTIDQMRSDYFQRFGPQFTGGLRRLYDGGAFFTDGYQDHGITETAPGHAATMSGRFPVHTGISTNREGVNTTEAPLVDAPEMGASPFRFRGTTLLDWMKAADARTRFLSVSRKDRGAILPIGSSKGPVYWYSPSTGLMTTSRYYADSLPSWVKQFNGRQIPESYAGKAWTPLLAASAYPEVDSVPIEALGRDYGFPHELSVDPNDAVASFPNYPWMDEMTLAFALEGVRRLGLGDGDRTDLLAVSLSTTDAVGHKWGPDSKEMHDQMLRLDRALGAFLDSLFTLRDRRRIVIALTGDHGMSPFPQLKSTLYANGDAKLVRLDAQWDAFKARVSRAGVDTNAVSFESGLVTIDTLAFARAKVNADSMVLTFAKDAMMVQGVLRAQLITEIAKADTVNDAISRRWLHTLDPKGETRLVVTLTPFSYWESVRYATHGSPHDSDAHVPILFWGGGVQPGKFTGFTRVVDMAPTLAALLGVHPLQATDGHVLTQVVR